jgi:hypothetical protein
VSRAAWPLPLACSLVPVVAVHAAWALSRQAGLVPDCIPYLDGCTSISRAARHGAANVLFKLLMHPCAALQAIHWWVAARWVREHGAGPDAARRLRALGALAAVALAVYVAALGTEGWLYGWMRRYGITFYFAGSFLAMVVFVAQLRARGAARRLALAMMALCWAMLALGLASALLPLAPASRDLADRLHNVMEWHLGALFTLWFLLHAAVWRRLGLRL